MLEYIQSTGFFLPFLVVLSVLVFVHEFGHFIVARWCGVTVKAFSVGFGRELIGFTDRHGTRWKFSMIPLGGYVRFLGDEDESVVGDGEAGAQNAAEGAAGTTPAQDREGAFASKNVYQRAAIVAAGPIANFILAIVIFAGYTTIYGLPGTLLPRVGSVDANTPAAESGLAAGDLITAVNGTPITVFTDLLTIVAANSDTPLTLTIERPGPPPAVIEIVATPRILPVEGAEPRPRLGLTAAEVPRDDYSLGEGIVFSLQQSWQIVDLTVRWIGGLFSDLGSLRQLSGPVAIAKVTGEAAQQGIDNLVFLAGFLSISVGLFNLFPIPVLDGGRLVFYAIEALRGRPLSARAQDYSLRFGILLILLIMVVAFANDGHNLWGWGAGPG